jgi:uncharacterized membrane protein YidH (DUF202 family)
MPFYVEHQHQLISWGLFAFYIKVGALVFSMQASGWNEEEDHVQHHEPLPLISKCLLFLCQFLIINEIILLLDLTCAEFSEKLY